MAINENIWNKVLELRKEMLDYIREKVYANGGKVSYADYTDCPALNNTSNDEDIVVLDDIIIEGGKLHFYGSSSWDNDWWSENTISTDVLHEIYLSIDDAIEWARDEESEDWV